MPNDLVVILTALNLEYGAVRRKLADPRVDLHDAGTRFEVGTVSGTSYRVALGLTSKGNHSAAVLAERAIQHFKPMAVLFVGVAGALRGSVALGDVVLASHVYAYHGGTSEDDGLRARPRVWEADHGISQLGHQLERENDWADPAAGNKKAPRVHFGAIAAGEVVQNSRISREAAWIRQHYNDALAIEMEAAGVAQAGHLNGSPVAIIRGISDRADGTKNSVKDRTRQPRAAANAAAFAVRLAVQLMREEEQRKGKRQTVMEQTVMEQSSNSRAAGTPGSSGGVVNTAVSSTVGIMAGTIGSVVNHSPTVPQESNPTDLVMELDRFRTHLKRQRFHGTLDADTYHEAQCELDIARSAAAARTADASDASDTPAPPKKAAVMALRKLRGLLDDHPQLAAGVAALIASAGDPA